MNDEFDPRELFRSEVKDVVPARPPDRAAVRAKRADTPGHVHRRKNAERLRLLDQNWLSAGEVPLLRSQDELAWRKPGVQNGVYKKLRLGAYPVEARLDLHHKTVEEARGEVWHFVRDCLRYELRTVLIIHGRGDRHPERLAKLKSYVNHWLQDIPDVLAFHSALARDGGLGAVYLLLRKSDREKQLNRERFGSK